jgi:hypothetical protein
MYMYSFCQRLFELPFSVLLKSSTRIRNSYFLKHAFVHSEVIHVIPIPVIKVGMLCSALKESERTQLKCKAQKTL